MIGSLKLCLINGAPKIIHHNGTQATDQELAELIYHLERNSASLLSSEMLTIHQYLQDTGERTRLNDLVATFAATEKAKTDLVDYKIWEFTDVGVAAPFDPRRLDYKRGLNVRLHPEYQFNVEPDGRLGELNTVKFFVIENGAPTTNQIVQVDVSYTRPGDGILATSQFTRRRWVTLSGEFGPHIKETLKVYNATTQQVEIRRRRRNMVDNLLDQAVQFGAAEHVKSLFYDLDNEINAFIKTGNTSLLGAIAGYSGAWLDEIPEGYPTELRNLIIGGLTL